MVWRLRDAWLGDAMPSEGDNPPLDVAAAAGNPSPVEVLRGFYPAQGVIARDTLRFSGDVDYVKLIDDMERRLRGFFVGVLKQAGFQGKPHPVNAGAAVPASVEKLLTEMTFTSQFQAVRSLHESIAAQGESPMLLACWCVGMPIWPC